MKGSLVKFLFYCSTFLETFCKGSKREGVKFKYDLPGDLPMDTKQNAWTTVKENADGTKAEIKYKVTETPYYCWTCIICSLAVIGTICVVIFAAKGIFPFPSNLR